MAPNQPFAGQRNLALIRASGSTARILNLALTFDQFGASEEFNSRPLFRCRRLNQTLILKHVIRPGERALFERSELHTIKIVFPYSPSELGLGGTSVMVGERRYDTLLRHAIGGSVSQSDFESDIGLLDKLHELPSFDPFLLREYLRRDGHEPARCFFDISDADVSSMLSFVAGEIQPLINFAFGAGGRRSKILAMRVSERLMRDENAQQLDPLRETLQLSHVEFRRGVFAWKAFLYFKWLLGRLLSRQQEFLASLNGCTVTGMDHAKRMSIASLRHNITGRTQAVLRRVCDAMPSYDRAFDALSSGQTGVFRNFLLEAPAQFIPLGEGLGAVGHIHSFWTFRFPAPATPRLDSDEAEEIFQDFDGLLAGVELIRTRGLEEVVLP